MVKSIATMIMALVIIISGAFYEMDFVKRQFNELDIVIEEVYEKVNQRVAVEDDIYALQNNWLEKKKYLHIFIPHTEIKEVDLWIAESVKLVRDEKWEDAISKIEVLKELSEQIPLTFSIRLENIL